MVAGVVARDVLQGIPGQSIPAVVIDSLDGREGEEEHPLTCGHTRELEADEGAKGVKKESLEGVVVQGAIRVWYIEAVVSGVECSCHEIRRDETAKVRDYSL